MGRLALETLEAAGTPPQAVVGLPEELDPKPAPYGVVEAARQRGIPAYQPEDPNAAAFVAVLQSYRPDLLLNAMHPEILKADVLALPRLAALNLHFGPLPRYRGFYPIPWAIICGEQATAVTLHYLSSQLDGGDIIAQETVAIGPADTGLSLYQRCSAVAQAMLPQVLQQIAAGDGPRRPQDPRQARMFPRVLPYRGVINFRWRARQVYDYVRAMTFPPFPQPVSFLHGWPLGVADCRMLEETSQGGGGELLAVMPQGLQVQCRRGSVELRELDDHKGRRINLATFVERYKLRERDELGR